MAEMSEVKKFVLGLSDKEIMTLLGMAEKKKRSAKTAADASGSGKAWHEKMISGLDKNGEKHLDELKNQLRNPGSSHHVDRKQVRYLDQLKKMRLEVPPFFRDTIDPKAMYKHLVGFCKANDIPEEIVARVVPALISYIETGHMRPIIFVGEKGCGKTTAVKLLVEEALKLPTEVIKVPQTDGSHGMTGDCGTYQSADVGCIAKARLRANSLIVAYVFDEVDKVSHDRNRASVDDELLSITDESCVDVADNYLETTLVGLEHCPMFFTANDLQKVSPILADRCTVIKFPNANASRIKSISRKYADKQLASNLYSMVRFNYELMETHIDKLVQHNVTSLRKHQQLIESVLGNALNIALVQETEEVVNVTEDMFVDAEQAVLGTVKRRTGFC
ncbi:ATP-binding protein [[Ruminococcus] lactaris]|nr:ATP-binding protein [[Ruminococcus] lactaris]